MREKASYIAICVREPKIKECPTPWEHVGFMNGSSRATWKFHVKRGSIYVSDMDRVKRENA